MRTLRLPFLASALIASVGLSATVQAADLPRRTVVAPAPFVPVPVFTWTGFYVGANAGWGFSDNNTDNSALLVGNGLVVPAFPTGALTPLNFTDGTTALLGTNTGRTDAFVGGGQIGYNYQFTPGTGFVIGAEADIQGTTFDRRRNDDVFGFGGFGSNNGIFTAATVLPAIPGSGIAPPTGVGNGALGNVALFNGGLNGFGNGSHGFPPQYPAWVAPGG